LITAADDHDGAGCELRGHRVADEPFDSVLFDSALVGLLANQALAQGKRAQDEQKRARE
jgi:hypothetical protein